MAALAGARRTDSAYGRYLRAAKASDVMIDVPGPLLPVIRKVESLPGKTSSAAWLGLNAEPVIHGKIDPSFRTDGLAGSLDGEYFRQDKMTVLAGTAPRLDSTNELAITQPMAEAFGLHPGDHMTWQFYRGKLVNGVPSEAPPVPAQRTTFVVTAIVAMPPALGDQFDDIDSGILTPAATTRYLDGEFAFGWVAVRLRHGDAGVPALQLQLRTLGTSLSGRFGFPVTFAIRRLVAKPRPAVDRTAGGRACRARRPDRPRHADPDGPGPGSPSRSLARHSAWRTAAAQRSACWRFLRPETSWQPGRPALPPGHRSRASCARSSARGLARVRATGPSRRWRASIRSGP